MFWIYTWQLLWRDPGLCSPNILSQVSCTTSCLHDEVLLNLVHVQHTSGDCGVPFSGSEVFLWWNLGSSSFLSSLFVLVFVNRSLDTVSSVCLAYCSRICFREVVYISDIFMVLSTSSPDLVVPHRCGKISLEISYRGILHYVSARCLWKAPSDVMFSAVTQVTVVLL